MKINDIGDDRYKSSPHFTDGEKALMEASTSAASRIWNS
jgi:hypothetical protein